MSSTWLWPCLHSHYSQAQVHTLVKASCSHVQQPRDYSHWPVNQHVPNKPAMNTSSGSSAMTSVSPQSTHTVNQGMQGAGNCCETPGELSSVIKLFICFNPVAQIGIFHILIQSELTGLFLNEVIRNFLHAVSYCNTISLRSISKYCCACKHSHWGCLKEKIVKEWSVGWR